MDINELLDQLLEQVNLESELDRRRAFLRLVEYADLNLDFPAYAIFLTTAAVRLKQEKLLAELSAPRLRPNGKEKIHIRYDEEEGFQVIANPEGCLYLTRAFRLLSLAPGPGAHLHLEYDLPPVVGESYPAVLYMEDNDYFEREVENPAAAGSLLPIREVLPADIVGFYMSDDYPPCIGCSRNRVYRVLNWRWMRGQAVANIKQLRDDTSRMVILTFCRDDGQKMEAAFDLDDEEIGFVTRQDIEDMMEGES